MPRLGVGIIVCRCSKGGGGGREGNVYIHTKLIIYYS